MWRIPIDRDARVEASVLTWRYDMADYLAQVRIAAGMSCEDMAQRIGQLSGDPLAVETYRRWEAGEEPYPATVLPVALRAAGVNPRDALLAPHSAHRLGRLLENVERIQAALGTRPPLAAAG
jgi:hypothetical protein